MKLKKKVIVTGGSGLFGINFFFINRKKFKLFLFSNKTRSSSKRIKLRSLDLTSKKKVLNKFKYINPDVILHAAAITNMDFCQKNKLLSKKINENTTKFITDYCKKNKKKLIFISSDNVFFNKIKFKKETHKTFSRNYYGLTKINSENYIKKKLNDFVILRTNFFGWGTKYRKSFSDHIIDNTKNKIVSNLFTNVYFNPVYVGTLSKIIEIIIKKNISGIFNITSDNRISKYNFGKKIAKKFNLNTNYIKKNILTNKSRVLRPFEMTLDNKKIKKQLNIKNIQIYDEIKKLKSCKYKNIIQKIDKLI